MYISVTQYIGEKVPPHIRSFETLPEAQEFANSQSKNLAVVQATIYELGTLGGFEQCTFRQGQFFPYGFWSSSCNENSPPIKSAGELCLSKDQIIYGGKDTGF